MKRSFVIIMLVLTVLSVGGVIAFTFYDRAVTGGASPEIHFDREEISIQTNADDAVLLQGVTATDAEDGDVTESLMVESISRFVEKDTVKVTYVAYDSQNHVTHASRTARFTDYHSPVFSMGAPMIFQAKNVSDLMAKVGAKDAIDGDLSLKIHASFDDTSAALSAIGVHDVEFSVTNSLGDTARLLVPVRVVDDAPHSESILLKAYLVYLEQGSAFNPAAYLVDAGQAARVGKKDDNRIEVKSNVDMSKPGVYAVDYLQVKNDVTQAITRLIVVVE